MPKINREEYEVLKSLDEKWKWVARDLVGELYTFVKEPYKDDEFKHWSNDTCDWSNYTCDWIMFENNLFQFIQWEDEEPYNIAELIREYESEEAEVKRDSEWMKEEFRKLERTGVIDSWVYRDLWMMANQLDEPEVLSLEWIEEHRKSYTMEDSVEISDLQNLLVPKQEEVDRAYKDGYEKGREHGFYKGCREGLGYKGSESEALSQEDNINIVLDDLKEHIKEQQSLSQNVGMAHTPAGNDTHYRQYDYVLECIDEYEPSDDLKELLVPKQKELESTIKVLIEAYKQEEGAHGELENGWISGFIKDLKNLVEEEPLYYAKLKEVQPPEEEWLTNLSGPNYYAIDTKGLMFGEFILDLVGMTTKASAYTLKDWERHGINGSNADFVEVAE